MLRRAFGISVIVGSEGEIVFIKITSAVAVEVIFMLCCLFNKYLSVRVI